MSTGTKIKADVVSCKLTATGENGGGSVTFDIAAASNPLMAMGAHTVNKYRSQSIDESTLLANGKYEPVSLTVSFSQDDFDTIEGWWNNGTKLKYEVKKDETSSDQGLSISGTYENCIVRVSGTPQITPGVVGYVTCTIEIQCLEV